MWAWSKDVRGVGERMMARGIVGLMRDEEWQKRREAGAR